MHDVFIVGVPLIVILAGILLSRSDIKDLRAEMKDHRAETKAAHKELRAELHATRDELRANIQSLRAEGDARHIEVLSRLGNIDTDLRQFYHLTGKLEGRIEVMEKR